MLHIYVLLLQVLIEAAVSRCLNRSLATMSTHPKASARGSSKGSNKKHKTAPAAAPLLPPLRASVHLPAWADMPNWRKSTKTYFLKLPAELYAIKTMIQVLYAHSLC